MMYDQIKLKEKDAEIFIEQMTKKAEQQEL